MLMPKRPVSVTLEEDNLLWLRARAVRRKRRSLSDALDEVITAARTTGALEASRSVVGTIEIPSGDPELERADQHVRSLFETSLSRPLAVREKAATYKAARGNSGRQSSGARRARTRG